MSPSVYLGIRSATVRAPGRVIVRNGSAQMNAHSQSHFMMSGLAAYERIGVVVYVDTSSEHHEKEGAVTWRASVWRASRTT